LLWLFIVARPVGAVLAAVVVAPFARDGEPAR